MVYWPQEFALCLLVVSLDGMPKASSFASCSRPFEAPPILPLGKKNTISFQHSHIHVSLSCNNL
jgi:hypothetical protein